MILESWLVGSGPIWENFDKAIEPCNKLWWTNILWINNLYPSAHDDKCLPWTWFIPCYVQLSLLLPIILFFAKVLKEIGGLFIAALPIIFVTVNILITYSQETGGSIVTNQDFYGKWYMTPLMHIPVFLMGTTAALYYDQFFKERVTRGNSYATRFFEVIKFNAILRYVMYAFGIAAVNGSILWQYNVLQTT